MKAFKFLWLGLVIATPVLKAGEAALEVPAIVITEAAPADLKPLDTESLELTIWGVMAKKIALTPARQTLLDLLAIEATRTFATAEQVKAMIAGSVYATTVNPDAIIGMWISQRNLYWISNVSCDLWMSQMANYATESEIIFWTAALRQINTHDAPMLLELVGTLAATGAPVAATA